MATLAINPAYRKLSVEEFLDLNLGDRKAELIDGMIFMMAGGSPRHAAIAANLIAALLPRLRGSGCRPYTSDLALRTGPASIRFPDVSVYCNQIPVDPQGKLLGEPKVVFEVLSPSTASNDQITKLAEYRALAGVEQIVFVDPDNERVRIVDPRSEREPAWLPFGSQLVLDSLGITIPADEIFLPG